MQNRRTWWPWKFQTPGKSFSITFSAAIFLCRTLCCSKRNKQLLDLMNRKREACQMQAFFKHGYMIEKPSTNEWEECREPSQTGNRLIFFYTWRFWVCWSYEQCAGRFSHLKQRFVYFNIQTLFLDMKSHIKIWHQTKTSEHARFESSRGFYPSLFPLWQDVLHIFFGWQIDP